MERTLVEQLEAQTGSPVRLQGWLHHQRRLSKVTFLLLRDRSGVAQVVITDEDARASVASLLPETVIEVQGAATANAQAPGGVEVVEPTVTVLSAPEIAPPFELRRAEIPTQLPTLLDHAAVALRHPHRRAVATIGAASVAGFRATLTGLGFTEIFTPKVVASATETGANVFPIDWFGRPAFLAQSPQLYKQVMVGVFERVFEVAPVFRAEPHDTVRHLAEYVSLDVELGFIRDHHDVMRVLRDVLAGMTAAIVEDATRAIELLDLRVPVVPHEIPSIDFVAAQRLIEGGTGRATVGEPDLAPADERWLGGWASREHGSDFLFVTGYPMAKRPFYTHPDPTRPEASNGFDLLFRGLELVTGGQRLHRYADYVHALAGRDLTPYEGYLEAFRHGMPPHGGFAIGLERWLARLTDAANVREVTLFPRDINRLTP
ncbi:MAG: nondiscriminating aspartyl-tRNA synthetase [Actinomycetota bacterium]|nr:nondiscriminating aspartyl-tRNA synthetase [Actinomycetota bacterium]